MKARATLNFPIPPPPAVPDGGVDMGRRLVNEAEGLRDPDVPLETLIRMVTTVRDSRPTWDLRAPADYQNLTTDPLGASPDQA